MSLKMRLVDLFSPVSEAENIYFKMIKGRTVDEEALIALLTKLRQGSKFGSSARPLDLVEPKTVPVLRSQLAEEGVVLLTEALTVDSVEEARERLFQAWQRDVEPHLTYVEGTHVSPDTVHDAVNLAGKTVPKQTGLAGNVGFGYLGFLQPEAPDKVQRINLNDGVHKSVAVSPGDAYNANIALMSHMDNQKLMATLFALSDNHDGFVPADGCKVGRKDLTKQHVDIYSSDQTDRNRVQMIGYGNKEGTVRLCFFRFSHLPEVRALVVKVMGKTDLWDQAKSGFKAVPEKYSANVLDCFQEAQCIVSGLPLSVSAWLPGVIHCELLHDALSGRYSAKNDKETTTERYVLGTMKSTGLNNFALSTLGYIADEHGFFLHPYGNLNQGTVAGAVSVHRKTTQFKRPRPIPHEEDDRRILLQYALKLDDDDDNSSRVPFKVRKWIQTTSPRVLHCFGLTQPGQFMFDDPEAVQIFTHGRPGILPIPEPDGDDQ